MMGDSQDMVKGRQWTRPQHCPLGGRGERRDKWFMNSPREKQFYYRTKEASCTFPKGPYLGLSRLEGGGLFSDVSEVPFVVIPSKLCLLAATSGAGSSGISSSCCLALEVPVLSSGTMAWG